MSSPSSSPSSTRPRGVQSGSPVSHPSPQSKTQQKKTPSKKPSSSELVGSTAATPSNSSASKPKPSKSSSTPTPAKRRQRGTASLPMARVQRIIKADREVDICSREATFLITIATEMFIKKFADEAYTNARLDKRKIVQYKDISKAVIQNEYLEFLKEIVPPSMPLSQALAHRQAKFDQAERIQRTRTWMRMKHVK
ncbi:histone-fold-containing protein [Violaceomyces palustris]|uniref:Histone-fold-containing protein n=1 Tax=Violaceomyces palustris TaxID=1673888 RepID=A0ACD0NWK4_9BASI|nr:histone-fold-containing protein [Violaceomyces palustris]